MTRKPWDITREMFLSTEEVAALLVHLHSRVRNTRFRRYLSARLDQIIIEGLLFSGLRNSEFCALAVGDILVGENGPIFVVRSARQQDRIVHIPSQLSSLISSYIEEVRPMFLPDDVGPNDPDRPLVFNERRRPYERTGLYRRVVRILGGAGLGARASVQLLRHTYGYLAYARTGGNLLFVQRQLGHAHPMITSIYARFVDESYEQMAEMLHSPSESRIPRETVRD